MKFTVVERIITLNLLPQEGSFSNLKLLREAKESLSFTDKENKALNFIQKEGSVKWNDNAVGSKEIKIGEVATQLIVKALKDLDGKEKLTVELMPVYEKFIKG